MKTSKIAYNIYLTIVCVVGFVGMLIWGVKGLYDLSHPENIPVSDTTEVRCEQDSLRN